MKKERSKKPVGHYLRIARKRQKFTVEQLARKINMRPRYIEDIENGVLTDIPDSILYKLAIALGTTVAALKTGIQNP